MKKLVLVLFTVLICFSTQSSQAASFVNYSGPAIYRAYIFDNDTGGVVTTTTSNIAVQLLLNNNQVTQASQIPQGLVTFTSLSFLALKLPTPPQTSLPVANAGYTWNVLYTNIYGGRNFIISGAPQTYGVAVIPVSKATLFTGGAIKNLAAGRYMPNLSFQIFNTSTGVTTIYNVETTPVDVQASTSTPTVLTLPTITKLP